MTGYRVAGKRALALGVWDQDDYGKDPANVYVHLLSGRVYLLSGFEGIRGLRALRKQGFAARRRF